MLNISTNSCIVVTLSILLSCLTGLTFAQDDDAATVTNTNNSAVAQDPNSTQDSKGQTPVDDPNTPVMEQNSTDTMDEDEDEDDIFPKKLFSSDLNYTFHEIFTEFVDKKGIVDYSNLRRKRRRLFDATRDLKIIHPAELITLNKEQKTAFWINTYNTCTLKLIIDNYPIQPKWWMLTYPDDSIMQITGAWSKHYFEIQGLEYTLKEIEQEAIRQSDNDPRVCFAMSNATVGGAILRNESFVSDILYKQLDDQVKKYLSQSKGFRLDKEKNILFLSNLFSMHKQTFLDSEYVKIKKFRSYKPEEKAWLNFIFDYLPETERAFLENNDVSIRFSSFDWHLNGK